MGTLMMWVSSYRDYIVVLILHDLELPQADYPVTYQMPVRALSNISLNG
jgi:hypothetical protein